jgi:aspartyl-tRNA(Asn)/glutamyl-tRNA(Gln) amidotransferase subunit C
VISKEEIQKLAELSRIELEEGEVEALQKDISNILEYVETVSTVEIPQSEASRDRNVPVNHNVMRDDVPYTEGSQLLAAREAVVEAFPKSENGYNVVRKIIQKDE